MSTYWDLWAKTSTDGRWHTLPYHLLDVAAAAEALWDRLPPTSRECILNAFGTSVDVKNVVAFLAGAHDIGKANRFFQAKNKHQADRLRDLGYSLAVLNEHYSHGQATGAYLAPWLTSSWGWNKWIANATALAVGGHHGTFFENISQTPLGVQSAPWCDIGSALLNDLAQTLNVQSPREPAHLNPFLGWLAGFVTVADWLGSHESMTIWRKEPGSLSEYLAEARVRAAELLDQLGWYSPPNTPVLPIVEVLPSSASLNPLQDLATRIAPQCTFAIVEAPTGEGKTEAAFALTEPARSKGSGVFFALPTMATSNGLFGRVNTYLQRATGSAEQAAKLLHSQAWLFRDKFQIARNPQSEDQGHARESHDWFVGSKRGLLAPYGVGTIDQALIASLRARHGFVRLFALAGKTIVIDEVHAYDVYMADLLDVLLGWLRALGCRVILLSATLPKARRKALLDAWKAGIGGNEGEYPCVTWIDESGAVHCESFAVKPRKPLSLQLILPDQDQPWRAGAAQILQRVREHGGVGALVLNTVRDAQAAFKWLRSHDDQNIELHLFHARFTVHDRNIIEQRVLSRFGKYARPQKPVILVATQVIEQSLDLDFDHMVSALAPIDLLLQRAGRLHRHRRTSSGDLQPDGSPDERPDPVLFVIQPNRDEHGLPLIDDPVYAPDILMRTLQYLQFHPHIKSPADISEAIEAVYSEFNRSDAINAWEQRLLQLEAVTSQTVSKMKTQASRVKIVSAVDTENLIIDPADFSVSDIDRHEAELAAYTRFETRPSISLGLVSQSIEQTIHGGSTNNLRDAMMSTISWAPPNALLVYLMRLPVLPHWQRNASLSHTRVLILSNGVATYGDNNEYEIAYDSTMGLEWRETNGVI